MFDQESVAHQHELLQLHRRTLQHYLTQRATFTMAYAPPSVSQGIFEARENIRRIKRILRGWGIQAEDQLDDDSDSDFSHDRGADRGYLGEPNSLLETSQDSKMH